MYVHFQYAGAVFELKSGAEIPKIFTETLLEYSNSHYKGDDVRSEELLLKMSELVIEQPDLLQMVVKNSLSSTKHWDETPVWHVHDSEQGTLISLHNQWVIMMCCGPRRICVISPHSEPESLPWNTELG